MEFLFFIIGFIVFAIIVVNISDYNQKQKKKQKPQPRRVTVDSLSEVNIAKQHMIREFEKVIEIGIKDALNNSVKIIPPVVTNNAEKMQFIKREVNKYFYKVRNDSTFTEVLTLQEINYSIEKVYKRVMKQISNLL